MDEEIQREAEALVALAFRTSSVESVRRSDRKLGIRCPTCGERACSAGLSAGQLERAMKNAIQCISRLLWLRDNDYDAYWAEVLRGEGYAWRWTSQP